MIAEFVAAALDVEVVAVARLGGGDVAQSSRVELADGRTVFAKGLPNDATPAFFKGALNVVGLVRWRC